MHQWVLVLVVISFCEPFLGSGHAGSKMDQSQTDPGPSVVWVGAKLNPSPFDPYLVVEVDQLVTVQGRANTIQKESFSNNNQK